MRIFLILWFVPLAFFWGWYALSANDISFGTHFFSRALHDQVFAIYANMLKVQPEQVPGLIAGVFAFDTAIVLGIAAIRWRKSWVPQTREFLSSLRDRGASEQDERVYAIGVEPGEGLTHYAGDPARPAG